MKLAENSSRISQLECRLSKYTYLSRHSLPGYLDALVLQFLAAANAFPDRTTHPNFYHWYILMRQFSLATLSKWRDTRLYLDPQDSLPSKFVPDTCAPLQTNPELSPTDENPKPSNSDQKNTKSLDDEGAAYVIEIELPCGARGEVEVKALRAGLKAGRCGEVEIGVVCDSWLKVRCRERICKCEDLANLITNLVEFRNIQIKREKKRKNSCQ